MPKFYIEGEQTMDEMSHIDYKVVKGGKGNISKVCPMKFALNNCKDYSCSQQSCAWYCQYPNGEGECAIHSLPGMFEGLDNDDIIESLTRKNPLKEVKTAKVITRTINKP